MDVIDMFWRARNVEITAADQHQVTDVLADVAGLRRWLDGVEVACARRLEQLSDGSPSLFPEHVAATATRSSLRRATRTTRRAATADKVPEIGAALAAGEIFRSACRRGHCRSRRTPTRATCPACRVRETLAELAARFTPDEFRRQVIKLVHRPMVPCPMVIPVAVAVPGRRQQRHWNGHAQPERVVWDVCAGPNRAQALRL